LKDKKTQGNLSFLKCICRLKKSCNVDGLQ
jgi:hypothetical protein